MYKKSFSNTVDMQIRCISPRTTHKIINFSHNQLSKPKMIVGNRHIALQFNDGQFILSEQAGWFFRCRYTTQCTVPQYCSPVTDTCTCMSVFALGGVLFSTTSHDLIHTRLRVW